MRMPRTSAPPGTSGVRAALSPRRWPAVVRRHWLVSLLLAAGLALRALTQVSFSPALLYIDSVKYLYGAWPAADPLGYDAPLRAILLVGDLRAVEAVQHLLGLAMAVTLYLVLLRRGAGRWLAALATGPVLLDAYQLQMEATIMPDVWLQAVIVAGLTILLWRPRATVRIWLRRAADASASAASCCAASSRARSTRRPASRFCSWLFSFCIDTTIPVGRCVIRTAESVVLTLCPPGPEER